MGFESRGVYIWPSGNIYSGTWLKGKRHGEGVQVKGRWIYRGAFTTGFCGRYGVKESLTSCAKYEGSWHLNQFDGFGVETNSDGSTYAGAWSKGMRQGLGVRRSAPYALAAEFSRAVRAAQSQNSIPSGTDSERGWRGTGSIGGGSGGDVRVGGERGRPDERRSGFVLRASSCLSPGSQMNTPRSTTSGYRSATPTPERGSIFKRGIFRKLRKQKSTGDLSLISAAHSGYASSGCGGGGLFHGSRRRAGGSLRSTLSGSSQLTTNSFGHTDMKGMGNGGQGFHEIMEEPPGPNVTESYSGQWNEDRRSGYGVAERSDGLRYAGEWFNNKKDGYGVTYRLDGSKEEGRYKENILIQALNRKSKLFLLRHAKFRDAVDEAVKNAEDAAKKAQESSAESAYQRAQTARMVANTADSRARDARKLSDQARSIAREFSPDFVQLGLQWEKQNPLLKKELFGVDSKTDMTDSAHHGTEVTQPNSIRVNNVGPNDLQGLGGHSLEVSGGSRQGSFRSSFRRRAGLQGDARGQTQNAYVNGNASQQDTNQGHHVNRQFEDGTWRNNPNTVPPPGSADQFSTGSPQIKRSPAGRPIARAATTGVTGISHSQADQRQMAQHMAQHPHSPYLMASTSQHLDELLDSPTNPGLNPNMGTLPRDRNQVRQTGPATRYEPQGDRNERPKYAVAQISMAKEERASEIRLGEAELMQPSETLHAALRPVESSVPGAPIHVATTIQKNVRNAPLTPEESIRPSTPSTITEVPVHLPPRTVPRVRRRTLPSIITEPPAQPQTGDGRSRLATKQTISTSTSMKDRSNILDDDAIHSAENLPANAAATYIIENGIRKRVQAVTQHQMARHVEEERASRRPEWTTAYDPYRPGMESTMIVSPSEHQRNFSKQSMEPSELQPLPRAYRIDSELSLACREKESSMPDLPTESGFSPVEDGILPRGYGGRSRNAGLTHEELVRLTQARRLELIAEMERRKKGEIVIRLADIKDWVRANFVIVFVVLLNAVLVFVFFNLLSGGTTNTNLQGSGRLRPRLGQPISGQTPGTVQLAKKIIADALKKAKTGGKRGGQGNIA
ncbi:unnamed protein product [Calicophoron daubneyi]|uniref:Junctophilin n=1 Tax=Calicophoron daubneyi TaxID=300641 RepID=A0AAV2TRD7_CALDB